MVVTVVWLQSWTTLVLSVGCLFVLILFIFFCTCFDKKKKVDHFYVIDEDGMKKENDISPCSLHIFRRLSPSPDPENGFSSKNLPFFALDNERREDLMDSMEVAKSFETGLLRIDDYEDFPMTLRDEMRSCLSQESLNSFYSAHPSIARGTSKESFVSLISEFDDNLV